jgi:hypothetical protein
MREDVDPRIDKMIAFLYGELPPAEEKAFRRLLEKDDALRAEWEELASTRGRLAAWKVEEHVPSFVLVDAAPKSKPVAAGGSSAWRRFLDSLRPVAMSPAWGLAAAAMALVVLAAAGFRVERVPNGVAFRFGGSHAPAPAGEVLPGVGSGQPLELAARPSAPPPGKSGLVPVSGSYLTQEEFNAYNSDLMNTLVSLLNRYDEQRDKETTELLQGLYAKINERQMYDYERTNRRIDALGAGLLLESNRSKSIDDVLQGADRPARDLAPAAGKE